MLTHMEGRLSSGSSSVGGWVVGAVGALSGRHERKVQSVDCGVRLIYEGCDLKTRYSSRLAV